MVEDDQHPVARGEARVGIAEGPAGGASDELAIRQGLVGLAGNDQAQELAAVVSPGTAQDHIRNGHRLLQPAHGSIYDTGGPLPPAS